MLKEVVVSGLIVHWVFVIDGDTPMKLPDATIERSAEHFQRPPGITIKPFPMDIIIEAGMPTISIG